MLKFGDRVQTNLEHAWLWHGTEWQNIMAREREGTVIETPWSYRDTGFSTIRVKWDSLTGSDNNGSNWTMWVHSNLITPVQATEEQCIKVGVL